jgi:hypothetical protein
LPPKNPPNRQGLIGLFWVLISHWALLLTSSQTCRWHAGALAERRGDVAEGDGGSLA